MTGAELLLKTLTELVVQLYPYMMPFTVIKK